MERLLSKVAQSMRRLNASLILVLSFFFVVQAITPVKTHAFMPGEWSDKTDVQTADSVLVTGAGFLYGIVVMTDGANAVTIKLYDNTSASGTRLLPDWEVTSSATDRAQALSINPPIPFSIGVYCDITTSGTVEYMGFFRKR